MDHLIAEACQHLERRSRLAKETPHESHMADMVRHPCPIFACWQNLDECRLIFFPPAETDSGGGICYAFVRSDVADVQVLSGPLDESTLEHLDSNSWGRPVVYRYRPGPGEGDAGRVVSYLGQLHEATRKYYARLDAARRFGHKIVELREADKLDDAGLDESALHSGLLVLVVSAIEAGLRDVFHAFPEARFRHIADDRATRRKALRRIAKQMVWDKVERKRLLRRARRRKWTVEALQDAASAILDGKRINFQDFSGKGGGKWAYRQFLGISLPSCAHAVRTEGWRRLREMLLDRHRVAHAFEEAELNRETLLQDIDGARRFFGNVLLRTLRLVDVDRTMQI